MLGELSVVPLMIYLWRLGYIGFFLGTLRAKWDLWWLLRGEGETLDLLMPTYFLNSEVPRRWRPRLLPSVPDVLTGGWPEV